MRVHSRSTIIRPALLTWENHAELRAAIWRVCAFVVNPANLIRQIAAKLLMLRLARENLLRRNAEPRQRRWLQGKRLCRPRLLARNVALRHPTLFHWIHRFACLPI